MHEQGRLEHCNFCCNCCELKWLCYMCVSRMGGRHLYLCEKACWCKAWCEIIKEITRGETLEWMKTEVRVGAELFKEWYIVSSHERCFSVYFNFQCHNSPYNVLKLPLVLAYSPNNWVGLLHVLDFTDSCWFNSKVYSTLYFPFHQISPFAVCLML